MIATGQSQPVTSRIGMVKGTVKDSLTGEALPLATVSAFRSKDSAFVAAVFSGNNGSFSLRSLPVDTTITVTISYVGYRRWVKRITLSASQLQVQLGDILLSGSGTLADVVIKAELPPLRMKGDTLEINPAAFNAGPNAVVEDMLKKVPGVVVWGDNKITVNGKPVEKLLVDGKPFLTGSITVATQNLPPEIIDKVQVYKSDKRTEDDLQTMNLVLKEEKKHGQFGKLNAAAGTSQRYEGDITWNRFKPRQQLSLGAIANNTNKTAGELGGLMQHNTYRGNISSPAFQSNFNQDGINRYYGGGLSFTQELPLDKMFNAGYFGYSNSQRLMRNETSAILVGDSSFTETIANMGTNTYWNHSANGEYDLIKQLEKNARLNLAAAVNGVNFSNLTQSSTQNAIGRLLNRSNRLEENRTRQQQIKLGGDFNNFPTISRKKKLNLTYEINAGSSSGERKRINDFESFASDGSLQDSTRYNRLFNDDGFFIKSSNSLVYNIDYLVPRLRNALIRKELYLTVNAINNIRHQYNSDNAAVSDFDKSSNSYALSNAYLTNTNRYHYLEEKPGIAWSVNKRTVFSQRFSKTLLMSGRLEAQYQLQHNRSDKDFRNIRQHFMTLLPAAGFSYTYIKHEAFQRKWEANYATATSIPGINQLATLVDSTNLLYIQVGNPFLKMEYSHALSLGYSANKLKTNQALFIRLSGQTFNNRIVSNSYINAQGQQRVSFVNATNYRTATAGTEFKKPIQIKKATLNLSANGYTSFETGSLYVNNRNGYFNNWRYSISGDAYFIRGSFEIRLNQLASLNYNSIHLDDTRTTSYFYYSGGATVGKRMRQLSLGSMVSLDYNKASLVKAQTRCIWNAWVEYRLLKTEQLACRFSISDILKQNRSIVTSAFQNKITQAETNRLTQFALLSISYYPRQFGKKAKT